MSTPLIINFDTANIDKWLAKVSEISNAEILSDTNIVLDFSGIKSKSGINPIHIVSLACLIEHLHKLGYSIALRDVEKNAVSNHIWYNLKFKEYWSGGKNYVPAHEALISNLWRIIDAEKEIHSDRIHNYLKQEFFQSKDLSAVRNSLDEAYYNIFDHAEANGNAFSFVEFNEETEKLFVAVCDFGVGIATLVKQMLPNISSDKDAIAKALEYRFTTGSQKHNMGMGLGNIKDTCTNNDRLIIFSKKGKLIANRDNMTLFDNEFSFPGTLVYYELSLSNFEDEEIIDNFVL